MFCGCLVGVINGSFYVLGGFLWVSVMCVVWRYDFCINRWASFAVMEVVCVYCKIGVVDNKFYVVGGVDWGWGGLIFL